MHRYAPVEPWQRAEPHLLNKAGMMQIDAVLPLAPCPGFGPRP